MTNRTAHSRSKQPTRQGSWLVAATLLASFSYAGSGLRYAFATQRNFRIHVGVGLGVLGLALWLQVSLTALAILMLTVGAVMVMELVNTAIEAVVDLVVEQTYHDLARIAKDCAAGAVLISALVSVGVGLSLLGPPLWERVQSWGF
ncbi:diacylglycerol kinase [Prochlorothrix hollandica PCC 9006 = CALU 1027]|uniref:Diacylglycerol kinase n=1 Tax=Prochlorothrix hollandica PCC 9006 = CALU 1027 TaxID=317619 RepID=A0A0M2PYA0_PROHO|nr:diacylglycerol kinase [Prochlorothrix hollandica PCC 9006 = CALU 1027]